MTVRPRPRAFDTDRIGKDIVGGEPVAAAMFLLDHAFLHDPLTAMLAPHTQKGLVAAVIDRIAVDTPHPGNARHRSVALDLTPGAVFTQVAAMLDHSPLAFLDTPARIHLAEVARDALYPDTANARDAAAHATAGD